jgi:RNA polymerase sigma factor (sigma-70 family)
VSKELRHSFVSGIALKYGDRLRRFLSQRLRNVADAPDLAQEVFLRLMRVEHHETIRSPEAYLFTVASHVLHQHTLRQSQSPKSVDISELFSELQLTSSDDPAARVATDQRMQILQRAMQELPPKIATTLWLSRFAGQSLEEIAQHLGVSRPSAKLYLARALRYVKDADERADKEVP